MIYISVVKNVEILMRIFQQGNASAKTFGRTHNAAGKKAVADVIFFARQR